MSYVYVNREFWESRSPLSGFRKTVPEGTYLAGPCGLSESFEFHHERPLSGLAIHDEIDRDGRKLAIACLNLEAAIPRPTRSGYDFHKSCGDPYNAQSCAREEVFMFSPNIPISLEGGDTSFQNNVPDPVTSGRSFRPSSSNWKNPRDG